MHTPSVPFEFKLIPTYRRGHFGAQKSQMFRHRSSMENVSAADTLQMMRRSLLLRLRTLHQLLSHQDWIVLRILWCGGPIVNQALEPRQHRTVLGSVDVSINIQGPLSFISTLLLKHIILFLFLILCISVIPSGKITFQKGSTFLGIDLSSPTYNNNPCKTLSNSSPRIVLDERPLERISSDVHYISHGLING